MGRIDVAEFNEARELTRLLERLKAEASQAADEADALVWRAVAIGWKWGLPAFAPLLAWRGELVAAFLVLILAVIMPAAYRSMKRLSLIHI